MVSRFVPFGPHIEVIYAAKELHIALHRENLRGSTGDTVKEKEAVREGSS